MRFFTCVIDPEGRGLSEDVRRAYDAFPRRRGLEFRWSCSPQMAVLIGWDDPYGDPLIAHVEREDWAAVGTVRLDNRPDLMRWAERDGAGLTDLELVRRVIARHGTRYVPRILGDFAFVAWNRRTQSAVAACDAFGVQRLYYAERDGLVAFASRAEALALEEKYEVRYLAELVSQSESSHALSIYAGVLPVRAASLAVLERGRIRTSQYWHASDFAMEPSWTRAEHETIETCRGLLIESVRQRMKADGGIWAQLSGGLDSSSVVSLVQWLAERGEIAHGLAGTVTFVDHHATGTDEREYSGAVVDRWGIRNEPIVDPPTWYDECHAPPHTDQPRGDLHVYPRDSRLCAVVRGSGGRVLLTGSGGDELFTGNMLFFADWLVRGRVMPAMREMARRAAMGRVSFWKLAYRNALLPLLPRVTHDRLVRDQHQAAPIPWLERAAVRRYGLKAHAYSAPAYGGKLGQKYHHAIVSTIGRLRAAENGGTVADSLEVRHPLLYRPLVEFALRLPPELRARPHAHRWVLRQAMRGVLPEKVRTRVGKPGTADFLTWSLSAQRAHLAPLVREPILAQLGIVDSVRLRAAFDTALRDARFGTLLCGPLFITLAVEAWLQIRSGGWPCRGHQNI